MSEPARLDTAERWEDLIGRTSRSGIWHRLRHTVWAGLVTGAFVLLSFFQPIDQLLWMVQSRLSSEAPSGEYVYIGADEDLADPLRPDRRGELASVLERLDDAGVDRVYIDYVFDEPASPDNDTKLADAVSSLGNRVAFVAGVNEDLSGPSTAELSLPELSGSAVHVVNPDYSDLVNVAWWIPHSEGLGDQRFQTLASALVAGEIDDPDPIMVDYAVPADSITLVPLSDFLKPSTASEATEQLAGKQVIIGPSRAMSAASAQIPGARNIPRGVVAIYAAESHLAERNSYVPSYYFVLAAILALVLVSSITRKRIRRTGYALVALSLPGTFIFSVTSGVRTEVATASVVLFVFAMLRLRFHWQRRAALRDEETGLGTLRALEEALGRQKQSGHVIVAKVHGYERVLKLLPTGLHSTYIRKIAERIKATESDLELFAGSHFFAWQSPEQTTGAIEDHLNGLRALFGAPLDIGGTPIDVGMTFGVARVDKAGSHALPAAMDAVEETSEAHEPVRFAVERSQDDNLWDVSLRSRIDAAMNNGEVYCLYQPKYALNTGSVAGVEALVRWDDPERGPIPPLVFVRESEKAGRIEQLTRYVLQSACTAGRLLHSRGHRISVSVNVSAIQCSDTCIVTTVEEALSASGFPASYLVLEVTETARIRDLSKASRVLGQLKDLGVKLSMDDFGVGMANYETFYELPFDELKIDRLFIKNIQRDEKARAIASSLVKMGSEARITVTAEGVEDPEDLAILEEIGCSQVQGYAISRPITLPNLLDFLEKRQKNMV